MEEKKVGWHHPVDNADQWDGFNEPGLEHFSGQPIVSLAREVVQNSLDAKEGSMAEVRFEAIQVKTSDIPDVVSLTQNLELCRQAAKDESKKAQSFFEEATKMLSSDKITVLQASDHYTKGMVGPAVKGTPFYAFMKAKGKSQQSNDTATGAFGIGKFAPYNVSKLRTIFVSTIYEDEESHIFQQLTQGRSILMSHDKGGERRHGIGFWGNIEKCQPVSGTTSEIPKWLQRSEGSLSKDLKGSTLSILGFDATNGWELQLALSVAENFFGAIFDGHLRVIIGDKFKLDSTSIFDFFDDEKIKKSISSYDNEPENFDNRLAYLTAHSGGVEVITEESEQSHLGLCQLKLIVSETLPRKVCILRNGMFITDSLSGLKRFSDFKDFVAVFHCQSTKGNSLLRAMEPPKHDDFEPARLYSKEEQRKGKKALADLAEWVKGCLRKHAKDPIHDVTSLDEMKDLFGDEGDGDNGKGLEEINPYGSIVVRAKPIRSTTPLSSAGLLYDNTEDDGYLGEIEGEGDGGGGDSGEGHGDGHGGTGAEKGDGTGGGKTGGGKSIGYLPIDICNVRSIVLGNSLRKIGFTPYSSGTVSVELKEAGADSDYPLAVRASNQGEVFDGKVRLDVKAGERVVIEVELSESFTGAVKVGAHEIR